MFKALRPTGNRIVNKTDTLPSDFFSPYQVSFYQTGTASLAAAISASIKKANLNNYNHPEILIPAYACPDLVSAIDFNKATPILVDFEKDKPWMSLEDIQKKITSKTAAIIAVNFLGIPERVQPIKLIADNYNILVIEDSAQGFPARNLETYWKGDYIVTSFGKGKPINLLGGGSVLTKLSNLDKLLNKQHYKKFETPSAIKYQLKLVLYNILINPSIYYWLTKIPLLSIGSTVYKPLHNINFYPSTNYNRIKHNYESYIKMPKVYQKIHEMLLAIHHPDIIDLPAITNFDFEQPLLRYPILVKNRYLYESINQRLIKKGLGASNMYKKTLLDIKGVNTIDKLKTGKILNAQKFSECLITLPTHSDVTDIHISIIETIIKNSIKAHNL